MTLSIQSFRSPLTTLIFSLPLLFAAGNSSGDSWPPARDGLKAIQNSGMETRMEQDEHYFETALLQIEHDILNRIYTLQQQPADNSLLEGTVQQTQSQLLNASYHALETIIRGSGSSFGKVEQFGNSLIRNMEKQLSQLRGQMGRNRSRNHEIGLQALSYAETSFYLLSVISDHAASWRWHKQRHILLNCVQDLEGLAKNLASVSGREIASVQGFILLEANCPLFVQQLRQVSTGRSRDVFLDITKHLANALVRHKIAIHTATHGLDTSSMTQASPVNKADNLRCWPVSTLQGGLWYLCNEEQL